MDTLQQALHQSLQAVQAESSPALIHSGKLLNFAPSQISQLQDDLQCLYGNPLPRFPEPQDISGKLAAVQRLHRQIPAQNGILWQHFRQNAAELTAADDAALTDVLLRWLFTRLSAADHT
ncbi:TPA: hypothetical protein RG728_000247 [Morganella morganii subsp. morganii]|uniref:Uncharacterized protein n=1 Tax=Morganella morganii TaxID=582 RepID=A0AAU8ZM29_MORMO|nr:hypothetical protein [Morganella morganii]HDU8691203.1 hypothetical protein [Morganella morganii subsp. morganii]AWC93937.1 hypothetical protein AM380_09975 [Morganella morganii]EKW8485884.1 hypothetical protein [Morganella morganii]EKW8488385.1 hypothetical protein [Morganella morganii]HAT3623013.1 hypothetical protein [Morganella morganii]